MLVFSLHENGDKEQAETALKQALETMNKQGLGDIEQIKLCLEASLMLAMSR